MADKHVEVHDESDSEAVEQQEVHVPVEVDVPVEVKDSTDAAEDGASEPTPIEVSEDAPEAEPVDVTVEEFSEGASPEAPEVEATEGAETPVEAAPASSEPDLEVQEVSTDAPIENTAEVVMAEPSDLPEVEEPIAPSEEAKTEGAAESQPVVASASPSLFQRLTSWKVVIAVLAVLLIAAGVFYYFSTHTDVAAAVRVSDSFMHDVQKQNAADAYKHTSVAFQQNTSEQQLSNLFASVAPQLSGTPSVYGKKAYPGKVKEVVVEYVSKSTGTSKVYTKFILVEDKGQWQVFSVSFNPAAVDLGQ